MARLSSVSRALLALALPLFVGCPGSQLKRELTGIKSNIDQARANGAYLCAPVELAMAESHYSFAKADLYYGDYFSAKEHVQISEQNAKAALDKTPGVACRYQDEKPVIVPKVGDRDGDGLLDDADKCPDEPEDKDNFEDEDGCPELDNDKDGIPDNDDKCPNDPETKNGYQDEDGCPDELPVDITAMVGTLRGINFGFLSDKVTAGSRPALDRAAAVMLTYPGIRIEIQGHTDDEGDPLLNEALSLRRAEAVRQYLIQAGVPAQRLRAAGFGGARPIADNRTAAGKAKNRRVEVRVLTE